MFKKIIKRYSIVSPQSVKKSPLSINIEKGDCNEFCVFDISLQNTSANEVGMVNLIFYVPSGLKINLNDLQALKKQNKIGNRYFLS